MMATRLRELEANSTIRFCLSVPSWTGPGCGKPTPSNTELTELHDLVEEVKTYAVDPATRMFMLGEMPYITGLYERARAELDDDENLSIDGVKEMVLAARDGYKKELGRRARKISPKLLSSYFKYARNLSLIDRRMTPDLYTLIVAAQQIIGDQFAIELAETARQYPYEPYLPFPPFRMGVDEGRPLPDGEIIADEKPAAGTVDYLEKSCQLIPKPPKSQREGLGTAMEPVSSVQLAAEEDEAIENFRTHVKDAALAIMGGDLARSEKFSTSLKDGLDIRETLRNWHTGDLYVKVFPPTVGTLDCVVMLFDSPADPRDYPWRITWQAEHHDESTLALFATDFHQRDGRSRYRPVDVRWGDVPVPAAARCPMSGAIRMLRFHRHAGRTTDRRRLFLQRVPAHRSAQQRSPRTRLATTGKTLQEKTGPRAR